MKENSTDFQLKLFHAAKKRGWDPTALTGDQFEELRSQIMTATELVKGAARAVVSRTLTTVGLRTISLEQAKGNEAICRSNACGRFRELPTPTGREPACDGCGCAKKWLKSKWRDRAYACPVINPQTNQPYWDNRG